MLKNKSYAQVRSLVWTSYGLKNILDPFECVIVLHSLQVYVRCHISWWQIPLGELTGCCWQLFSWSVRADGIKIQLGCFFPHAFVPVLIHTIMKAAFVKNIQADVTSIPSRTNLKHKEKESQKSTVLSCYFGTRVFLYFTCPWVNKPAAPEFCYKLL